MNVHNSPGSNLNSYLNATTLLTSKITLGEIKTYSVNILS